MSGSNFVRGLLVLVTACAWIGVARANPIMAEGVMGVQVPETSHAQVSYYFSMDWGMSSEPSAITRDGQALDLPFLRDSVTVNGGSGLDSYDAMQICDCDLPPGTYAYRFIFPEGGDTPWVAEQDITVTILAAAPPAPDDGPSRESPPYDAGEEEIMPWDIPEPPWPKGADCAAWCLEHPGPSTPPDPEDTTDPPDPEDTTDPTPPPDTDAPVDTSAALDGAGTSDAPVPMPDLGAHSADGAGGGSIARGGDSDGGSCTLSSFAPIARAPWWLLVPGLLPLIRRRR